MLRTYYLRLYDRLWGRPWIVLAVVTSISCASAVVVPRVSLDMSFRPLFGQDEATLAATRLFEERFGQRSGAYVGAVVSPGDWTAEFVERLAAATEAVQGLDHVSGVVSLATLSEIEWVWPSPETSWVFEPGELRSVSEEELDTVLAMRHDPRLSRSIFSPDRSRTLLLARIDLPLTDLHARTEVIREVRKLTTAHLSGVSQLQWVGISVVEEAYARLVLQGIGLSLVLTTGVLLVMLFMVFRRLGAVVVVMSGVSLALPMALAVMVVRGQAITIVNSMVPTMIMIIGVADAIHMFQSYTGHMRSGASREASVRSMFGDMALPCLLTAVTTAAGFAALEMARIAAIRDFGLNVAIGVSAVYLANLMAVPTLLRILPERMLGTADVRDTWLVAWQRATTRLIGEAPGRTVAVFAVAIGVCALGILRLDVDQRFNEDLAPDHEIREAQARFERDFTGILGPDVEVSRTDGTPLLFATDRERIRDFVAALAEQRAVLHVESVLDHLPDDVTPSFAVAGFAELRERSGSGPGPRVRDVISEDGRRTALVVRTADIGARNAIDLVDEIRAIARRELGPDYDVGVVGQWWLAQLGLSNILRDMLVSFATSFVLVLPLLAIALGSVRLFLVALVPNLLPMFFALGFMGWTGISVRVGTAMILAIAFAIAVDDTIHMLVRLREGRRVGPRPEDHVEHAIEHSGSAVVLTTVILVAGFLSMRVNGLVTIQEMGLVAAATLTVALLSDVYLLGSLYLLAERYLPQTSTARFAARRVAPDRSGS